MTGRVVLTGDTHGNFVKIRQLSDSLHTDIDDLCIVLGDGGVNLMPGSDWDMEKRDFLKRIDMTVFFVRGNHDIRPSHLNSMELVPFKGAMAYHEKTVPNVYYAVDGTIYTINGNRCLVIGGAYSVDKYIRLEKGYPWFEDEQLTWDEQQAILDTVKENVGKIDYIFSHTVPLHKIPLSVLNSGASYGQIDYSMEQFLQEVMNVLKYDSNLKTWYAGHYHMEYSSAPVQILYDMAMYLGVDVLFSPYDELVTLKNGDDAVLSVNDKTGQIIATTISRSGVPDIRANTKDEIVNK